jgi:UDPglucose 6-dehydrogenase
MKVCVYGLYHLGCVISSCLANLKIQTIAIDNNDNVIDILVKNTPPIFEPGLKELFQNNQEYISFCKDFSYIKLCDFLWFASDTEVNDKDQSNEQLFISDFEKTIPYLNNDHKIIISSQIPIGTCEKLRTILDARLPSNKIKICYSPENLRLGQSIEYFLNPDRIVIGIEDEKDKECFEQLFSKISSKTIFMSIKAAELVKHGINSFLATSIVFANEMAAICEKEKIDFDQFYEGFTSEQRIGKTLPLKAGMGFSGGTLARDINFLIEKKTNSTFFQSLLTSNEKNNKFAYEKIINLKNFENLKCGIIGVAYKVNTDTLRRSAAIELYETLRDKKITVNLYDKNIKTNNQYCFDQDLSSLIKNNDCIIIFSKQLDLENIDLSIFKDKIIIDPNGYYKNIFPKLLTVKYYKVGGSVEIKSLKDFNVVVTGGTSGFGYTLVKAFLQQGASVSTCGTSQEKIDNLLKELEDFPFAPNQKFIALQVDVSKENEVKYFINETISNFQQIHMLINNAGIHGAISEIENTSSDEWIRGIQNNLFSVYYTTKNILPHFKKMNFGKIINLSGGGEKPLKFFSSYATSKSAVVKFTEICAEENKESNIFVNAIAPGLMLTNLTHEVINLGPNQAGEKHFNSCLEIKENGGTDPILAASLCIYLASDLATGITGKLISAKWDDWYNLHNYKNINLIDKFTMRRVS